MTIHINQRAPTRDGVELATDVYLPDGPGPWPSVLVRTPYHRADSVTAAHFMTSNGFAYAVQDVRGKFDSDGAFVPVEQEAEDGADALDWVAGERWCNGRIGMVGRSYLGIVQIPAASSGHEALRCIIPGVAPLDFFHDWIRYDGCFALANMIRWPFEHNTQRTRTASSHLSWKDVWSMGRCGSIDDLEAVMGTPLSRMRVWLKHDALDDYWRAIDQNRMLPSVRCPGAHAAGYFDHLSRGQLSAFAGLTGRGSGPRAAGAEPGADDAPATVQHLLIGPWGHSTTECSSYGCWEYGPAASVSHNGWTLRYLNLWLKDMDDGVASELPVRYFQIGENRWRQTESWPPPDSHQVEWYLGSDGSAAGLGSRGTLTRALPSGDASDTFTYDPADPVPTNGGQVYWGMNEVAAVGPADQRPVLTRSDVLLYRSRPLPEPVRIAGNIEAVLWAASSAEDTDFIVKLCVQDTFGAVTVLTLGSIQARFRYSSSDPEPLAPGSPAELRIQMNAIAYTFPRGSRIALTVTSSCFPRILPHRNRFEPTWSRADGITAEQTVLHGGDYPSRLILPVAPD